MKLALIVIGVFALLAVCGGGYFIWAGIKHAETEKQARVEHAAQLQVERDAQARKLAQLEAEAIARQKSLEQSLIEKEKEDAIRIANETAAIKEAEAVAAEVPAQAALQLERDAKQQALQDSLREQVTRDQRAAIQRMLINARTCLSQLNYSCVITNADNALSFEPGNKTAQGLKRTAEDAQNKATQNIRID